MKLRLLSKTEMFEEVYKEHFAKIYNYIYYRIGNAADAEDLTADVFVRAYEYFDSFDREKGDMRAWLGGIARNVVNTYFRRRIGGPQAVELNEFLAADVDIESELQNQEEIRFLLAELRALPERHQELLTMKYFLGMNNREIAKELEMSESAVGVNLYRILGRLRKKFSPEV